MRPRVFPAEDVSGADARSFGVQVASMRPRVFPAEDSRKDGAGVRVLRASMRPRVFPAEDRENGVIKWYSPELQ